MKLPSWIPKVGKPNSPDYGSTWEQMADNEKRWSFLIDLALVALVIIAAIYS